MGCHEPPPEERAYCVLCHLMWPCVDFIREQLQAIAAAHEADDD